MNLSWFAWLILSHQLLIPSWNFLEWPHQVPIPVMIWGTGFILWVIKFLKAVCETVVRIMHLWWGTSKRREAAKWHHVENLKNFHKDGCIVHLEVGWAVTQGRPCVSCEGMRIHPVPLVAREWHKHILFKKGHFGSYVLNRLEKNTAHIREKSSGGY